MEIISYQEIKLYENILHNLNYECERSDTTINDTTIKDTTINDKLSNISSNKKLSELDIEEGTILNDDESSNSDIDNIDEQFSMLMDIITSNCITDHDKLKHVLRCYNVNDNVNDNSIILNIDNIKNIDINIIKDLYYEGISSLDLVKFTFNDNNFNYIVSYQEPFVEIISSNHLQKIVSYYHDGSSLTIDQSNDRTIFNVSYDQINPNLLSLKLFDCQVNQNQLVVNNIHKLSTKKLITYLHNCYDVNLEHPVNEYISLFDIKNVNKYTVDEIKYDLSRSILYGRNQKTRRYSLIKLIYKDIILNIDMYPEISISPDENISKNISKNIIDDIVTSIYTFSDDTLTIKNKTLSIIIDNLFTKLSFKTNKFCIKFCIKLFEQHIDNYIRDKLRQYDITLLELIDIDDPFRSRNFFYDGYFIIKLNYNNYKVKLSINVYYSDSDNINISVYYNNNFFKMKECGNTTSINKGTIKKDENGTKIVEITSVSHKVNDPVDPIALEVSDNKLSLKFDEVEVKDNISGYKAVQDKFSNKCILELKLLPDSKVATSVKYSMKLRTDKAEVIRMWTVIEDKNKIKLIPSKEDIGLTCVYADKAIEYKIGTIVTVDDFDPDLSQVCVPGIHFCLNTKDALSFHHLDSDYPDYIYSSKLEEPEKLEGPEEPQVLSVDNIGINMYDDPVDKSVYIDNDKIIKQRRTYKEHQD